jgi:propionyl-CoA synthetase
VPVIDHWWQTETGWAIAGNPSASASCRSRSARRPSPCPGYDVQVLDDAGHPVPAGTLGNIVVKLPLPPGLPADAVERRRALPLGLSREFPGYYKTATPGYMDEDGYLFIMARTDDIINVAGHRLSTGGMEEVLAGHPDVAECAVIGIADQLKGQLPGGLRRAEGRRRPPDEEIEKEVVKLVRDEIGPVAAFKIALTVERLPKTRSGKILRGTMQKIADGEPGRCRRPSTTRRSSTRSATCLNRVGSLPTRSARSARRPRPRPVRPGEYR